MVTLQVTSKDLLLDKHDVAQMFKVSEQKINLLLRTSDFPQPFKLGNSFQATPLWRLKDLKAWIDKHYGEKSTI